MPIRDDDARKAYFREYMRKRRAGIKPEKKLKPERGPDWEAIDRQVSRWKEYPWRRPVWAGEVMERMAEFDLSTEEGSQAFLRLFLKAREDHHAELEAQREEEARREAEREAKRKINWCSFCDKPQSEDRRVWGGEGVWICDQCIETASKDMALKDQGIVDAAS